MFANIIYYDKEKIDNYKTIINGKKNLQIDEYQVSNDKGFSVDFKAIGGDTKATKSYNAKVQESLSCECTEFEKMLYGRDDYRDFTQSDDYCIDNLCRGQIIKFDGYIRIPEEFDLTQTIGKFKPMIADSIVDNSMDKSEKAALDIFLETKKPKIPALVKYEEMLMTSKLVAENMKVQYEEMEEYEDLEVTIIARVTSNGVKSKTKPYYDPLRDFMTINRTMRRGGGERTDGLYELYVEEDYRTIEILAIYQ